MPRVRPPARTHEQRMIALEIANEKRIERAKIKDGDYDVVELLRDPPECLLGISLYRLLLWEPRMGEVRAKQLMEHIGARMGRRVTRDYNDQCLWAAREIEEWRTHRKRSEIPPWGRVKSRGNTQ